MWLYNNNYSGRVYDNDNVEILAIWMKLLKLDVNAECMAELVTFTVFYTGRVW